MTDHPPRPATHTHWRLYVGAALGVCISLAALALHAATGLAILIGWNSACVIFLALTWTLFAHDETAVRMRAAVEDQGAPIMTALVLCAVVASLAATFLALSESKAAHGSNAFPWPLLLSVSTLVMSWLVIQTIFTLRYAHEYFGDDDKDGDINGGVKFPGAQPRDYRAFIYMSVCVGCTSQVSDFNILSDDFRGLVTTHALISFAFNVSVLALGVNMAASVLGQ